MVSMQYSDAAYILVVTRKILESVKYSLTFEGAIRNHGILNVFKGQLHTYDLESFQGIENGNIGLEWLHALLYYLQIISLKYDSQQ